jgi:hypothetical protein
MPRGSGGVKCRAADQPCGGPQAARHRDVAPHGDDSVDRRVSGQGFAREVRARPAKVDTGFAGAIKRAQIALTYLRTRSKYLDRRVFFT